MITCGNQALIQKTRGRLEEALALSQEIYKRRNSPSLYIS
jgi:hypothetical protein